MDVGLYLAPERTDSGIVVDIFDHRDSRMRWSGDVLVISQASALQFFRAFLWGCACRTTYGTGVADDGFQVRGKADGLFDSEAETAALGHDKLQGVAHGGCVPLCQNLDLLGRRCVHRLVAIQAGLNCVD